GLLGVGADHDTFQRLFAARTAILDERWVDPIDALAADVEQAERQLNDARRRQTQQTAELWADYKTEYERYFGEGTPDPEQASP
ncbi:MAG: hypothetical protein M3313_03770, partial [Actinomycetota bacterium]|nr:hypothetical protein [Actinomycetota bacterium]